MELSSEPLLRLVVVNRSGKQLSGVYSWREVAFRIAGLAKMELNNSWWIEKP